MVAYKCDICGKYCDDVYEISGFDIYQDDWMKHGFDNDERREVRQTCKDCYVSVKEYIHAKVFKALKSSGKERTV